MAKRITATWHLESICAKFILVALVSEVWLQLTLAPALAAARWLQLAGAGARYSDTRRSGEKSENGRFISWSLIESVFNVCSIIAYIQRSSYDCRKLGLFQIMQRASNNTELKNFVVQGDGTSKRQNKHSLVFCDPSLLF